jgi:hypothetical protein
MTPEGNISKTLLAAQSSADAFLRKLKDDFGLSAPQVKTIEQ